MVKRIVTKGCPQGSCRGPGFWNIKYSALLNFSIHTRVIAFADDLAVLTKGKIPSEAEAYVNLELAKIKKWAKDNKMQFNETKSQVMLITRKRNITSINIYINNRRLEVMKEIKYLGIHFDNRLTFNKHIKSLAENSSKLIHMLGRSAKLQWALGNKALKTIYERVLIPLLTYGAPVWEEAEKKKKNIHLLQRFQRMINIKIAKAYRTTSSEASWVMSGVQPIGLVIEEKASRYKIKLNPECDLPLPVKEWPHPTQRRNGRITLLADQEMEHKNWPNTADEFKTTEDKGDEQRKILIYTDGSKNEHGVGSRVAIFVQQRFEVPLHFRLGIRCSNNQAEQLAIFKALEVTETIDIQQNSQRTIDIFTDSRITIDLLKNANNHSYLIEEIRKRLSILDRANWIIGISWVKAHVGIYCNELADQLAKAAT
jgi:ribonuclease HI